MAVKTAYDGLAREWDAPAGVVYRPLARSLVAASPVALAGCLVLDVYGSAQGRPAVVADVLALPLRDERPTQLAGQHRELISGSRRGIVTPQGVGQPV